MKDENWRKALLDIINHMAERYELSSQDILEFMATIFITTLKRSNCDKHHAKVLFDAMYSGFLDLSQILEKSEIPEKSDCPKDDP